MEEGEGQNEEGGSRMEGGGEKCEKEVGSYMEEGGGQSLRKREQSNVEGGIVERECWVQCCLIIGTDIN